MRPSICDDVPIEVQMCQRLKVTPVSYLLAILLLRYNALPRHAIDGSYSAAKQNKFSVGLWHS